MSFQTVILTAPVAVSNPGVGEILVLVDTSDAGWSDGDEVTLPNLGVVTAFGRITIKDYGGTASTKSIVVSGDAGIDGQASYTLSLDYASVTIVKVYGAWRII
jgi:hypothetical protein